jgi:hypothetical protein
MVCAEPQVQAQGNMDPGLSKRIRDVGLIQDPQTLDQTAKNVQIMIRENRHTEQANLNHTRHHQSKQTVKIKESLNQRVNRTGSHGPVRFTFYIFM